MLWRERIKREGLLLRLPWFASGGGWAEHYLVNTTRLAPARQHAPCVFHFSCAAAAATTMTTRVNGSSGCGTRLNIACRTLSSGAACLVRCRFFSLANKQRHGSPGLHTPTAPSTHRHHRRRQRHLPFYRHLLACHLSLLLTSPPPPHKLHCDTLY